MFWSLPSLHPLRAELVLVLGLGEGLRGLYVVVPLLQEVHRLQPDRLDEGAGLGELLGCNSKDTLGTLPNLSLIMFGVLRHV